VRVGVTLSEGASVSLADTPSVSEVVIVADGEGVLDCDTYFERVIEAVLEGVTVEGALCVGWGVPE
jgi:hypothetical protein